jgi:transcriptional regulator with XRE-family HTH domain
MATIEIGNNIRRIREIKNYTQEAVAEMVGLSVTAYGDIERGKTDVNFTRLGQIAEALEVKPEEIVTFGSVTYNNTVTGNDLKDAASIVSQGTVNNNNPSALEFVERSLFDEMMKDNDEEIAFLRGLVGKG